MTLADIGNDVEKNVDNSNSLITAFSHFGDRLVMFGQRWNLSMPSVPAAV